jgi:hypothetical protein
VIAGADLTVSRGRPLAMETDERISSIEPAGVMAMACAHRRPEATREAHGDCFRHQLATRERQAGPYGVAERRKGALVKEERKKVQRTEGLAMSLTNSIQCSEVAVGIARKSEGIARLSFPRAAPCQSVRLATHG